MLRLQGFEASVAARCTMIEDLLAPFGQVRRLPAGDASARWAELRALSSLGEGPLWRINLPPSQAPVVMDLLSGGGARALLDWAGGLIWAVTDAEPEGLRGVVERAGGHATLIRATAEVRARIPAFHPPQAGVAALEERVRRAFDPAGLFETGRF